MKLIKQLIYFDFGSILIKVTMQHNFDMFLLVNNYCNWFYILNISLTFNIAVGFSI